MSDALTEVAIHESAHVIALLAHGHVPDEIVVGSGGGHVAFPSTLRGDDEVSAVVGLAGGCAVLQVLGPDADCNASASDCQFLAALYAYADRNYVDRTIRSRADFLVSQHVDGIVALANSILARPSASKLIFSTTLNRDDLADIVRSTPSLSQFASLFPERRMHRHHSSATSRGGSYWARLRRTSPGMSGVDVLVGQLLDGGFAVAPEGMTRRQWADELQRGGR